MTSLECSSERLSLGEKSSQKGCDLVRPDLTDAMNPSALDLREKMLTAYLNKEGTIRQLAPRFTVSARFVGALIIRLRRTGSYAPKPHGGGNPPGIPAAQQGMIAE